MEGETAYLRVHADTNRVFCEGRPYNHLDLLNSTDMMLIGYKILLYRIYMVGGTLLHGTNTKLEDTAISEPLRDGHDEGILDR